MTTIRVGRGINEYKVEADGHASGSVQVCAGISSLLYALDGFLENHEEIESIRRDMEDGKVCFHFKGGDSARDIYESTVIGLAQIAHTYPDFAKIISISW